MRFHNLRNTCLLGGFNPVFLGDSLGFFPNFELGIEKDTLDRRVQLIWTICAMQQWDNICPHMVVCQFHIVGNSISAILVHGIQLTQFGESLKLISLHAVDLTSHHGLVPSTLLLVKFKCLEPDL